MTLAKNNESKFKLMKSLKNPAEIKQEQNDDDYWGRDIHSPIPLADSARGIVLEQDDMTPIAMPDTNPKVVAQASAKNSGGFVNGMYRKSVNNFNELVPPIESSHL